MTIHSSSTIPNYPTSCAPLASLERASRGTIIDIDVLDRAARPTRAARERPFRAGDGALPPALLQLLGARSGRFSLARVPRPCPRPARGIPSQQLGTARSQSILGKAYSHSSCDLPPNAIHSWTHHRRGRRRRRSASVAALGTATLEAETPRQCGVCLRRHEGWRNLHAGRQCSRSRP